MESEEKPDEDNMMDDVCDIMITINLLTYCT